MTSALGLADVEPGEVRKLDSVEHIPALQRIGKAAAELKLKAEDFAGFL